MDISVPGEQNKRFSASSATGPTNAAAYRTSFLGRSSGGAGGMVTDEIMDDSIRYNDDVAFDDVTTRSDHQRLDRNYTMDGSSSHSRSYTGGYDASDYGGRRGGGGGGGGYGSGHKSLVDVFLADDGFESEDVNAAHSVVSMEKTERAARAKKIGCYLFLLVILTVIFVTAPTPGFLLGNSRNNDNNNSTNSTSGPEEVVVEEIQGQSETVTKPPNPNGTIPMVSPVPASTSSPAAVDEAEKEIYAPTVDENRPRAVREYIIEQQVTKPAELQDLNTPAFEALEWIATEDKAQVDIPGYDNNIHNNNNDNNLMSDDDMGVILLQRYALAVFYFSMEEDFFKNNRRRRRRRNREQLPRRHDHDDNRNRQLHETGTPTKEELDRQYQFEEHWTTPDSVCDWYGITCNERQFITDINVTLSTLQGKLVPELFQQSAFPALTSLDVSHNELAGKFPHHPIRNRVLQTLRLQHNQLVSDIDPIVTSLQALTDLDVTSNIFTGSLPTDWSNVSPDLVSLKMGGNDIHGELPTGIGLLTKLEWLQLDGNALTGSFPDEWSSLTSLRMLQMAHNQLHGTLPQYLGDDLPLLNHISLQDNQLTGRVPSSLGKLTDMTELHLQMTKLEGTVPKEVCDLIGDGKPLQVLTSDCKAPKIECSCCTSCY